MTVPAKTTQADAIEDVLARGDLSKLTAEQRTEYYTKLCHSLGLNPLTQPFEYLTLNNRLVLYAKRACADQLRKINGISIQVVSQDVADGLLSVHVRAKDATGREDEDLGVVNFPETLRGDPRANAILKAVTKAKRRVTLSICGLGFLDETEVEDIPSGAKAPPTISERAAVVERQAPSHAPGTPSGTLSGLGVELLDWRAFGEKMVATAKRGEEFAPEENDMIEEMKAVVPKMHKSMMAAIAKLSKEPAQPKPADDPDAYRAWLIKEIQKIDNGADLAKWRDEQRPSWAKAFPPDIEDWTMLIDERAAGLGK